MSKTKKNAIIIGAIAAVVVAAIAIILYFVLQPKPTPVINTVDTVPTVSEAPAPPERPLVFPLTGLSVNGASAADPNASEAIAKINKRPLCIKIENSGDARPQTGISKADVVYETIAEGGITRFNCIYQSDVPEEVGPVRSARNSDISIVPQYQGVLFYSGANGLVLQQIDNAGIQNITEGAEAFHRVGFRAAPHNLYLAASAAYNDVENYGFASTLASPSTLDFFDDAKSADYSKFSGASGATNINIPFSTSANVSWSFVPDATSDNTAGSSKWLRFMDEPFTDATDGSQISATNVVVLWATYTPDAAGGTTWEINLNGSGKASVFSKGTRVDGTWEAKANTPPRFRDSSGNEILLTPGNTWFEILPLDAEISAS